MHCPQEGGQSRLKNQHVRKMAEGLPLHIVLAVAIVPSSAPKARFNHNYSACVHSLVFLEVLSD